MGEQPGGIHHATTSTNAAKGVGVPSDGEGEAHSTRSRAGTPRTLASRYSLRHEAGLSAGGTMPLFLGRYQFGPKSEQGGSESLHEGQPALVTFELDVRTDRVMVCPIAGLSTTKTGALGGPALAIDGDPVDADSELEPGQILQVGGDQFVIERSGRPLIVESPAPLAVPPQRSIPPTRVPHWPMHLAVIIAVVGLVLSRGVDRLFWVVAGIGVVLMFAAAVPHVLATRRRRRHIADARARRAALFREAVDTAARTEAISRRQGTGLPVHATRAIHTGRPLALPSADRGNLMVAVAVGPDSWQPSLVPDSDIDADIHLILDEPRALPGIPFVVDIGTTMLGIVGPREAALAVARHVLVVNAATKTPLTPAFDITTDRLNDWEGFSVDPNGHATMLTADLAVIDRPTTALRPTNGVALAPTMRSLPVPCTTVLEIWNDGSACIHLRDRSSTIPGLTPLGVTRSHASQLIDAPRRSPVSQKPVAINLPPEPPNRPPIPSTHHTARTERHNTMHTGAVLVTGPDQSSTTEVLASLVLDLVGKPENGSLHIFVIDRGDRSLIRLAQLHQTFSYATVDDLDGIADLLDELEAIVNDPSQGTAILVTSDVGPLSSFLQRVGRGDLARRLEIAIASHDRVNLMVAASGPSETELEPALLERFSTRLRCAPDHTGLLATEEGTRTISMADLSGQDLTGSIAGMRSVA